MVKKILQENKKSKSSQKFPKERRRKINIAEELHIPKINIVGMCNSIFVYHIIGLLYESNLDVSRI